MCVAWSTWQIAWYKALKTQQNALKCLEQDYRCSSPALAFPCSLLQREKWLEKHQYVLPVIKTRSNGRRRSNKIYCGWPCCTWDQFFLSHPALGIGWALHEQEIAGLVLPSSQPGQPSGPDSAWPRWSASKGEGNIFIPCHFTRHVFKPN